VAPRRPPADPLRAVRGRGKLESLAIWIFIGVVVAIKLPLAAIMLWWPFRDEKLADQAESNEPPDSDGDDGGPGGPRRPKFPSPRRGPHREQPPAAPPRVRLGWASKLARERVGHREAS